MTQMTVYDATQQLGITETILTTGEAGQIAGLMHKKSGKPYSKRTVSNWLKIGLLEGARFLGRDWAIPISALQVGRFVPPRAGRPSKPPDSNDDVPLRDQFIQAMNDVYSVTPSIGCGRKGSACVQAFADAQAGTIFDLIRAANKILLWGIDESGIYHSGCESEAEWYALEQLLETTYNLNHVE